MAIDRPHHRALTTLRQWLADGTISGGMGMPTEFDLAARLDVSRGTLRKVLAALTEEGLIETRRRGRRVGAGAAAGDPDQAVVLIGAGADDRGLSETQEGSVEDACLRVLHQIGRPVLLIDHNNATPARVLAALGRAPFGIICTQYAATKAAWREQFPLWRTAGIPLVVHGPPDEHPGHDCVCSDHEGGAYALTRALIAAGRRRILQVWHAPERPCWLRQREAGHARAMAEAGLPVLEPVNPPEEPLLPPLPDPAALERRAQAYLGFLYGPLNGAEPPDALMALNDINAAAVAVACRMLGRAVHAQVAVAGFDGNWEIDWQWRQVGLAPFLTVRKGNHAVGRALAEVLLERAAGRGAPISRCMPVEVVRPG
jgi:DNA-binding LacI/PurR family transcriptional regulator